MKGVSTTEMPGLRFTPTEPSRPFRSQGPKIGWLTAKANKSGAKYDITIKDAHGRVRMQKLNCGSKESNQYGENLNFDTALGEEFEVVVDNIKGAESVDLFIN